LVSLVEGDGAAVARAGAASLSRWAGLAWLTMATTASYSADQTPLPLKPRSPHGLEAGSSSSRIQP
jgi:hypothetical protein